MALMFCGEKSHQVDEKNRIRIPSCFKDMLGSNYVFGRGSSEGVIDILPKETLEKRLSALHEQLNAEFYDSEAQDLLTEYASNFTYVSEDSQGRVVIPEELKRYAGIEREVVTLGSIDHLVLMSAEKRKEQQAKRTHTETLRLLKEKIAQKKNV